MKEATACDVSNDSSCWDFLISVLRTAHPTGLGDSLRLTSVAEEYYRRMNGNGKGEQRKR